MENKRDIAFWLLVILVITLCIYFLFFIKSEAGQCINNPLVYGVSKYTATEGEFTCTCSAPFADQLLVTKDNILRLDNYNTQHKINS